MARAPMQNARAHTAEAQADPVQGHDPGPLGDRTADRRDDELAHPGRHAQLDADVDAHRGQDHHEQRQAAVRDAPSPCLRGASCAARHSGHGELRAGEQEQRHEQGRPAEQPVHQPPVAAALQEPRRRPRDGDPPDRERGVHEVHELSAPAALHGDGQLVAGHLHRAEADAQQRVDCGGERDAGPRAEQEQAEHLQQETGRHGQAYTQPGQHEAGRRGRQHEGSGPGRHDEPGMRVRPAEVADHLRDQRADRSDRATHDADVQNERREQRSALRIAWEQVAWQHGGRQRSTAPPQRPGRPDAEAPRQTRINLREPEVGFEPTTCSLRVNRSAN